AGGAGADLDRCHQRAVRAAERLVADHRAVLAGTVVVAGDDSRPDVDVAADVAIADVAQVVDLGTRADPGFLGLDEVAEARAGLEHGARAHPRERPHVAAGGEAGPLDHAHGEDLGAITDVGVPDHAAGADAHAAPEGDRAFQYHVDVQEAVLAGGDLPAHVESRGVGDRHAGVHQPPRDALLPAPLRARQFGAGVDALDFAGIGGANRIDGDAVGRRHGDNVGEVVLALGVVVAEALDPAGEQSPRCGDEAGVHLADGELAGIGVLRLDDAGDPPGASQDAPVGARLVELDRQH